MPRSAFLLRAAWLAIAALGGSFSSLSATDLSAAEFSAAELEPLPHLPTIDWDAALQENLAAQDDFDGSANWFAQWLPEGLIYRPYLAGEKESRLSHAYLHEPDRGWISETALGGKLPVWRFGNGDPLRPQGWQFDVEGAGLVRLDPENESDVEAVDFRGGGYFSYAAGDVAYKVGYYHLSSHVGDEFLLRNTTFQRINYVRDAIVLGASWDVSDAWRTYGELAYAPAPSGGAEPLEFQFGWEYSPLSRGTCHPCERPGWQPFAAVNVHLREEFDFGGGVNCEAGIQRRGDGSQRLLRLGVQYYNGKSLQYSFFDQHEELLGAGVWFDF